MRLDNPAHSALTPGLTFTQAAKDCYAVRTVGPGQHRVAFLSCTRYNYCNLVWPCLFDSQVDTCCCEIVHLDIVSNGGMSLSRYVYLASAVLTWASCLQEDSCCTDPHRWMKPLVCPQDFLDNDVCALHFVGWRKSGMPAVFEVRPQCAIMTTHEAVHQACHSQFVIILPLS